MFNLFIVCGRVCTPLQVKQTKKGAIYASTRIKFRETKESKYTYIDLIAFNDTAYKMRLTCSVGNLIYVEGHLVNEFKVFKTKGIKALIYFVVDNIQLIKREPRSIDVNDLEETIQVITKMNPSYYLDPEEIGDEELIKEYKKNINGEEE